MKTMKTMKRMIRIAQLAMMLLAGNFGLVKAQNPIPKPTLTVLNIDAKGVQLDPTQMGNLVRIEIDKLDMYDVTDRYDVAYLIDKNKLNINNCYGKMCLVEMGNIVKTDYMYSGSVELYGQTIVVTMRLINVKNASVEKTTIMEFLNLPLELQTMLGICIRRMFDKPNNESDLSRLTKRFNYENATNNPNKNMVNLQGPRFGYTFLFGEHAKIIKQSSDIGGFDSYPSMFQFGYQFEKQYLNEGNYQALFEVIPMVSGVDQQMFIPSLALLNGFRNTKNGWEVAIGPTFSLSKYAQMTNYNGTYFTSEEMTQMGITNAKYKRRLNSGGTLGIGSAFVFGIGKTVKSGKMNIPLNAFFTIPTKEGFMVGVSIGYNSKNNAK
jgi:hypothetical protein